MINNANAQISLLISLSAKNYHYYFYYSMNKLTKKIQDSQRISRFIFWRNIEWKTWCKKEPNRKKSRLKTDVFFLFLLILNIEIKCVLSTLEYFRIFLKREFYVLSLIRIAFEWFLLLLLFWGVFLCGLWGSFED
jgi:hypothetical protein